MNKALTTFRQKISKKRIILVSLAALIALSTPMASVQQALADEWDDQISSLRERAKRFQAQADALRAKADTLQNKLNQLTAQINILHTKIDINNKKHEKLKSDIAANQKKLVETQDILGEILASLYIDDEISTIELLASSQNIGDFVDKQEYRSSIRDQLKTTIGNIRKIRAKLESDKASVEAIIEQLQAQKNELAAQEANQRRLVNETRGQEAAYQQLVSDAKSQIADAAAAQRAYYASLITAGSGNSGVVGSFQYWGWSGNQGCSGGYPYCGAQDSHADPWGLYNRECVSYVAWALAVRFNKYVGHFSGQGNAYEWPSSAPAFSNAYRVGVPKAGDAVILPASYPFAPIGHAMIVESVSGDNVLVSQYNFYGSGEYSTMYIKTSGVIFLRFPPAA